MLTRRQLLLSLGAVGLPMTVTANGTGTVRFGALQSRAPFIDENDVQGSRARAFDAYRTLLRRSVEQHGPLDWLAGGAFPLSGPGPFQSIEGVALNEHSEEVRWLAALARSYDMQLTLGVWWLEPGNIVAPRLLVFHRDGRRRVRPLQSSGTMAGMFLELPERSAKAQSDLVEMCRRQHRCGVRIETLTGAPLPPGAGPWMSGGSAIVGSDGNVIASADQYTETCLVALV